MDENKKLSSEEQREKLKQEYLQELKLRKQILDKMKEANQMNKISENLEQVLNLAQISEDMNEFIEKLNNSSEIAESKLDISLENLPKEEQKNTSIDILNQIKIEMGLLEEKSQSSSTNNADNSKTLLEDEKNSTVDLPVDKKFSSKTLGDEEH